MPKDDTVYVGHMLDDARKATNLLGNRDRNAYYADEALRLDTNVEWVVQKLVVIRTNVQHHR